MVTSFLSVHPTPVSISFWCFGDLVPIVGCTATPACFTYRSDEELYRETLLRMHEAFVLCDS